MRWIVQSFVLTVFLAVPVTFAQTTVPADPAPRWWKGNLHTHTLWSDGDDFPEMVVEWYRQRGYNFLGLSDHNVLSQGQNWKKLVDVEKRGGKSALEKYLGRFGKTWVETRVVKGDGGADVHEVRLKPLGEFRALFEERGQFLMVQSEEVSDRLASAPIHLNVTNLLEVIKPQGGSNVTEVIENNFRAANEQAARTGQEILPHLNHPNFQWAVTAEEIAHAVSDYFFEVFNGHPKVNNLGDAEHAAIDRVWDIANTLRMKKLNAAPLFGLATDDSHHYHFPGMARSTPGRGWTMVRARHLTPESLIRAMKAGDFYASTGVTLREVQYDPATRELKLQIEPDGDATFTTRFVGTPKTADVTSRPAPTTQRVTQIYSDDIGKTFATLPGLEPSYKLTGDELYVRAIVSSNKPPEIPAHEKQVKQAWTQPVGWEAPKPDATAAGGEK